MACADSGRLTPDADIVLVPLAERVDECLARAGGRWTPELPACACPSGEHFRGAPLYCHVGPGFVAFDGPGLPFRVRRPDVGSDRHGLAYVPGGRPPVETDRREFLLGGFATLDPRPTSLGLRWYRVSICRGCG
jgi:hypothetical protein